MTKRPKISLRGDENNEGMLIGDISRLWRRSFDRRAAAIGLTRPQWMVLARVKRFPGIIQADLAELMEIKPITLARILDRLEAAGWIKRSNDAKDRRIKRLNLTSLSKRIIEKMQELAFDCRKDAIKGLSAKEQKILVTILKKIKSNLCNKGGYLKK